MLLFSGSSDITHPWRAYKPTISGYSRPVSPPEPTSRIMGKLYSRGARVRAPQSHCGFPAKPPPISTPNLISTTK